jgi:hypothetical protein
MVQINFCLKIVWPGKRASFRLLGLSKKMELIISFIVVAGMIRIATQLEWQDLKIF